VWGRRRAPPAPPAAPRARDCSPISSAPPDAGRPRAPDTGFGPPGRRSGSTMMGESEPSYGSSRGARRFTSCARFNPEPRAGPVVDRGRACDAWGRSSSWLEVTSASGALTAPLVRRNAEFAPGPTTASARCSRAPRPRSRPQPGAGVCCPRTARGSRSWRFWRARSGPGCGPRSAVMPAGLQL
jgi:hypothetical protein